MPWPAGPAGPDGPRCSHLSCIGASHHHLEAALVGEPMDRLPLPDSADQPEPQAALPPAESPHLGPGPRGHPGPMEQALEQLREVHPALFRHLRLRKYGAATRGNPGPSICRISTPDPAGTSYHRSSTRTHQSCQICSRRQPAPASYYHPPDPQPLSSHQATGNTLHCR